MKKILFASLFLIGCNTFTPTIPEPHYRLYIQSDVWWEGYIGTLKVSGYGDKSFRVSAPVCWNIQKRSSRGFMRVFVAENTYSFGTDDTWSDLATTFPFDFLNHCFNKS